MEITIKLVQQLIKEQFPQWSSLPITAVKESGHDNRTFHLGDTMSIRLPSGEAYASQIEKECKWLPYLQKGIQLPVTSLVAKGQASSTFSYPFSLNVWIDGETLTHENVDDMELAKDLANFLNELQAMEASEGPIAGLHNFYRGGDLHVYDEETREALKQCENDFPTAILTQIWEEARLSRWENNGVWVHGDVAVGNLLVKDQRLFAVIDFGILGVGDPACDYVMAWTYFDEESRQVFLQELACDDETITRAKGWALWKALITLYDENLKIAHGAHETICQLIKDHEIKDKNKQTI